MNAESLVEDMRRIRRDMYLQTNAVKNLVGKQLTWALEKKDIKTLSDAEFRVYSQFGDDGIIQYLLNQLEIKDQRFVEFGVENYNESNTRFLLENNNWKGLVMDGSDKHIQYIRNRDNYWRHDLTALCCFVTVENINQMLTDAGFSGEIGLLHIDIDGNDYWIWKAITVVKPVIVIVEYNSLFGSDRSITIPYSADFYRFSAHHSGLYAGCSLPALYNLSKEKGYEFVGCNSAGNNAYFVRADQLKNLKALDCQDGYVLAKFREHRDENGKLTFMPGIKAIECIRGLPVFDTQSNKIEQF